MTQQTANRRHHSLRAWLVATFVSFVSLTATADVVTAQGFKVLDSLMTARTVYDSALAAQDARLFAEADRRYEQCRQALTDDTRLALKHPGLALQARYLAAWCEVRRAELSDDQRRLEAAFREFSVIAGEDADSLSLYSSYMAGEALYRLAILGKYRALADSADIGAASARLQDVLGRAAGFFDQAQRSPSSSSRLRACAATRLKDIGFHQALLLRAADDTAQARATLLETIYADVRLDNDREATGLEAPLRYLEAVRQAESFLTDADGYLGDNLTTLAADLGSDAAYRLGAAALATGRYEDAIGQFRQAAEYSDQSDAHYWLGFLNLILNGSTDQLRRSSASFERFVDLAPREGLEADRLLPLLRSAEYRLNVLNVFLAGQVSQEFLVTVSRDDLKFLIRIAAATPGRLSEACLRTLEGSLEGVLALSGSEKLFYRGVVSSLRAEFMFGRQKTEQFMRATEILRNVTGEFSAEARYILARALSLAGETEQADALYRELVASHRSVRAFYGLAANLGQPENLSREQLDTTYQIYKIVVQRLDAAGVPAELEFLRINAAAAMGICEEVEPDLTGLPMGLDISGSDALVCPEVLSIDTSGHEDEVIYYETLASLQVVSKAFAAQCLRQIRLHGLPKLEIYPAQERRRLAKSSFALRAFERVNPGIPDWLGIDSTWRPRVRLVSAQESPVTEIDQCRAELVSTGALAACADSAGFVVIQKDIDLHDRVSLAIEKTGYYPLAAEISSEDPGGYADTLLALSQRVEYRSEPAMSSPDDDYVALAAARNTVAASDDAPNLPSALRDALSSNRYLRDCAYDADARRFLVVDCRLDNALLSYTTNQEPDTFRLSFGALSADRLISPEGIAIGPDGSIYVADWGTHRVVAFDARGNMLFYFGDMGNGDGLNFPTRIAVERDAEGLVADDESAARAQHLLVADRYGVHKFDSQGRYLDTPIASSEDGLRPGGFYAHLIEGYGRQSSISLFHRSSANAAVFSPR